MNDQTPPVKKKMSTGKIVAIVIGVIVVVIVVPIVILSLMVTQSLGSAQDKAKDAKIKSDVMQLRNSVQAYYDEHNNSYTSWQPDASLSNDIQTSGSSVQYKAANQNFSIYVKLPAAGDYYCTDSTGFLNEVKTISSSQQSCQ